MADCAGMDQDFSMKMGPAGNQFCCGKPIGCTNTLGLNPGDAGSCSFLSHRWKLDNIAGHRERMEARRAAQAGTAQAGTAQPASTSEA